MWRKQAKRWIVAASCAAAVGAAAWSVRAADEPAAQPSMEEMMKQYAALAEPGPQHEKLATLEGKFKTECVSYCDPAGPQRSEGEVVNTMILGGRFLQSEFQGEMAGMEFAGFGLTGFDNVKREYVTLWTDSMSTNWMTSTGEADASGDVITFTGSYDDPILKTTVKMRQVLTLIDDDHYQFQMHGPGPDGAEMLMMAIDYTRK